VAQTTWFKITILTLTELGNVFRRTRESKNITFEQIDTNIRIKPQFIEAIEEERFDIFSSEVMLKGFISNYAIYLELDADEMLAMYDHGHRTGTIQSRAGGQDGITFLSIPLSRDSSSFSINALMATLIIAIIIGSIGYYMLNISSLGIIDYLYGDDDLPFNNDDSAITLPTSTPSPIPTSTITPTATRQYYTGVSIELVIVERTWVQILVDNENEFKGFLEAGENRHWEGEKQVAVRASNAGGVEVHINGQNMGLMGDNGELVDQVWEKLEDIPSLDGN